MKRCPTCGESTIVNSWNFCRRDGAKLVAMPTCLACGTEVLDTDTFCVRCGERVGRRWGVGEEERRIAHKLVERFRLGNAVFDPDFFHFQVRCLDPACALAAPVKTVYRESANSVGEYHVTQSGHKCVVERIGEQES